MEQREIEAAVAEFDAAREIGEYFPQAWAGRLSLDDAYRLLLARVRRWSESGTRRIGWKVGLTAKPIQEQFGVHEPVFACLLSDGLCQSGHVFRHDELIEPGFENELCIVLGRDLGANTTAQDVSSAVAAVHPAFEIIETRGEFTGQLALAIADNAQQKAFVIGAPVATPPELGAVIARVSINDAEVATGTGDAVLGHPYNSVTWLAAKLAQFGEGLRAGDYIMSGSFTRQFPLSRSDRIRAEFGGIGSVTASVV